MNVDLPAPLASDAPLPVSIDDGRLDTPAILVDLDIVEDNLARMAEYAAVNGVDLRPHAKTHKSPAMARRQLAGGAVGICVSKPSEAEVFVGAGIEDVTIAYPIVGEAKLRRLGDLVTSARLTLVADSAAVLDGYAALARDLRRDLEVLVEVDTGMHRVGASPGAVLEVVRHAAKQPGLSFRGILTHAGHAHDVSGAEGIARVAREEAAILGSLREEIEAAGFEVTTVSAGSTLTAPYLSASDGITEIRPGTYIYNDLRTVACWSASVDQIAASVLATVVSAEGERITIDAGNKTLTLTKEQGVDFGHVLGDPSTVVRRLSEEHGVLYGPHREVGERLRVLPIHVCVWMDLQPEIYGVRGDQVIERVEVMAMRHSL